MATYSISDLSRREILRMSATLSVASVASARFAIAQTTEQRTPEQILGPFYPLKTLSQDADLTKVPGRPGRAEGLVLTVMGRVLNLKGEPVRNAQVEIWQANAHGRYTHPSDHNTAPLDPNFEGSAILTTDHDGRYRFKTIKPAAYPAGPNRMRPAHIQVQSLEVREPGDFEGAFEAARRQRPDALITVEDPLTFTYRKLIAEFAAGHQLPALHGLREFITAGGLISYGASLADLYRRAAGYIDKIFKGAKPAELPVQQPTKFELVINLKTAKALDLTVPPSLLARADEVIE